MVTQIGNVPSNLRIVDYAHGYCGSVHDAAAFESTAAYKYPGWFFQGEEFAWADSAYSLTSRSIPVHKEPYSLIPENTVFDKAVSHVRVRSEHCMGALKGRFQCLRGLRVQINNNQDHIEACRWITIAIILHNLVIDVEGGAGAGYFGGVHGVAEERDDRGLADDADEHNFGLDGQEDEGEAKRTRLKAELLVYREMCE